MISPLQDIHPCTSNLWVGFSCSILQLSQDLLERSLRFVRRIAYSWVNYKETRHGEYFSYNPSGGPPFSKPLDEHISSISLSVQRLSLPFLPIGSVNISRRDSRTEQMPTDMAGTCPNSRKNDTNSSIS